MEADGVTFALPLVAAPEFVKFLGPVDELFLLVLRIYGADDLEGGHGAFFVADGRALEGVEDGVGHEIVLVGLLVRFRAKLGGGILDVDVGEGGDGSCFGQSFGLHPAEPLAEVVLIDAGDGAESAGGVAVHGGVSDGGLGAIGGGEQEGIAEVGKHPDAGGADPGLNVLAGDVVILPGELAAKDGFDGAFISFNQFIHFPLGVVAAESFGDGACGVARGVAGIFGALVSAEEEGLHPVGCLFGKIEVGEPFANAFFSEFVESEVEHDFDEGGDGGGIGTATERDDKAAGPGFTKVIEVGDSHGAGEFLLL